MVGGLAAFGLILGKTRRDEGVIGARLAADRPKSTEERQDCGGWNVLVGDLAGPRRAVRLSARRAGSRARRR